MLSKHRDVRRYDEQWIVEATDVHGLMKDVAAKVQETADDGLYESAYWKGVEDTVHTLFSKDDVDNRLDFMAVMNQKLEKRSL